jgi:small subunit ribosomal protein S3
MGHKVNPVGFRLGKKYTCTSRWYAANPKIYQANLLEDVTIRRFLAQKLNIAGLTQVEIERSINKINLKIHVTRPGVVIGRGGSGLEDLKNTLVKLVKIKNPEKNLSLDVIEVKEPDLNAHLIAERIAFQIERRAPHKRAIKKTIERVLSQGAKGIKVVISGRIQGAEIGRTEKFFEGKVPLQTIRANIDYASRPALTKSGYVGVKVWINKGEK